MEEELTIEEKALRYDEAIINGLKLWECGLITKETYEDIFHELKESEDERIRKALMKILDGIDGGYPFEKYGIQKKDAHAWLKKKGAQKLINKIQLGKKYKCIASPRYSTFMKGKIYKPEDKFLCSLMNFCSDCFEPIEDSEYNYYTDGENNMGISEATKQKLEDNLNKALEQETPESLNKFLDEQEEQNSANNDEPKFKVADWTVSKLDGKVRQILGVHHDMYNNYYVVEDNEYDIKEYDRLQHHWTIRDAKDGDILATYNGRPFIFKGCLDESHSNKPVAYCGIDIKDNLCVGIGINWWTDENVYPATKEQHDFLFQKIKRSGYEWNAEKKELKKLTPQRVEHGKYYYCIKDYFCGGKKQASKGDVVQALRGLPIMGLENVSEYFLPVNSIKYNFLPVNSIKYNYSTWSEEDENMLNDILLCGEHHCYLDVRNIAWLKLLKERVLLQNLTITDEQIEALEKLYWIINPESIHSKELASLLEQLKKIKV